ncbi:MAG: hypothetical protein WBO95_05995 [Candidatus Dechloromonas phosphoritropha]|jgi:hypothetical protein|nr:hypothetical protein [Candidatus Dechloromonas phosphoritropha]MBP8787095.1 hypothetical protein [Azonexus sp.]MBP9226574.1 hypothetical protein [Azonexus sp.]
MLVAWRKFRRCFQSDGVGNPNRAALPSKRPELRGEPAIFQPPQTLQRLEMLRNLGPTQRWLMSRLWTEIKVK